MGRVPHTTEKDLGMSSLRLQDMLADWSDDINKREKAVADREIRLALVIHMIQYGYNPQLIEQSVDVLLKAVKGDIRKPSGTGTVEGPVTDTAEGQQ